MRHHVRHWLGSTGAGQYTTSMIQAVMQELTSSAFGNPHSRNPSSSRSTQEVSKARAQVLQHFNADPDEYYVVFTKGATEGLKMVGEFFPWHSGQHTGGSCCSRPLNNNHKCKESSSSTGTRSSYIYTQANHKSVLGIGAYAKQAGASLYCLNREQMHDWLAAPKEALPQTAAAEAPCCRQHGNGNFSSSHSHGGSQNSNSSSTSTCHLVAYPAKDNYEVYRCTPQLHKAQPAGCAPYCSGCLSVKITLRFYCCLRMHLVQATHFTAQFQSIARQVKTLLSYCTMLLHAAVLHPSDTMPMCRDSCIPWSGSSRSTQSLTAAITTLSSWMPQHTLPHTTWT
eukprot:GHRR01011430.1.p1 GENE.GHRR01011430.1~~GHRR01011430.1.p1  ORF type:complete len:340 (+),score=95.00 GHRR01011430.1:1773-2792(+)